MAAVMVAAAAAVLAVARDDGAEAPAAETEVKSLGAAGSNEPPAPWRTGAVPRPAVPDAYVQAWDRAGKIGRAHV
jgi:hypothetical protein